MDPSCVQYALSPDEKGRFERDGYLIVENALTSKEVDRLLEVTDRVHQQGRFRLAGDKDMPDRIDHVNFFGMDQAFMDLVDHPRTFPKVWGILGWNIYCYLSHIVITPQQAGTYDPDGGPTYRFHQDSGRATLDMPELEVPARLSMKVAFFLTDVSEPGRANFWVIPGSQTKNAIEFPPGGIGQPEGALPLCVEPGTAVLFDRRLWHAATPNHWHVPRRFLSYGYGYRWIRTKDEMTIPEDMFERADAVRRQLLGAATAEAARYGPTVEDMPLRAWLEEHQPSAVGR